MQHFNMETSEDVPTTVDSIPQPSTIKGFKFSGSDGGTRPTRPRKSAVVTQNAPPPPPPTIPYTNWICMSEPTCAEDHHLVDIVTPSSLPILPSVLYSRQ